MRTLKVCALSLALLPTLSLAEVNQTGQNHCKDFAAQQLKEIKQEYYGALTRDETDLALQVAEHSCLAMYASLEKEKKIIKIEAANNHNKKHWWEERTDEGKAIPNIRKTQTTGGK